MAAVKKDSKTLRAELAAAEKREKAERETEREARRAAQREADTRAVLAYREANYEAGVGPVNDWVGVDTGLSEGGVSLTIMDWTSPQTSVTLTREEALELVAVIQKLVK